LYAILGVNQPRQNTSIVGNRGTPVRQSHR
jgi:hypothetical protein